MWDSVEEEGSETTLPDEETTNWTEETTVLATSEPTTQEVTTDSSEMVTVTTDTTTEAATVMTTDSTETTTETEEENTEEPQPEPVATTSGAVVIDSAEEEGNGQFRPSEPEVGSQPNTENWVGQQAGAGAGVIMMIGPDGKPQPVEGGTAPVHGTMYNCTELGGGVLNCTAVDGLAGSGAGALVWQGGDPAEIQNHLANATASLQPASGAGDAAAAGPEAPAGNTVTSPPTAAVVVESGTSTAAPDQSTRDSTSKVLQLYQYCQGLL